jgi:hypothetical protein
VSTNPTPQGVSRLLAKAGFERGVSNPPDQACAGYAVIPNRPDDGIVLVTWWADRDGYPDIRADRGGWLERYTAVLAGAGLAVRQGWYENAHWRELGPDYLIVTAPGEGQ